MKLLLLLVAFGAVVKVILAEESQVLKEFADENVQYISELYKEVVKMHPGNFLVSPLSIQTVFALVNSGAGGNTAKQITTSLHLPEGEEKIKATFLPLSESLQTNDKYTLSSVNKIYVADYFKINEKYNSTAVDVFHSEIQDIDFRKTKQAVAEINGWIEKKTHEKIKNLLNENMLSTETVAVLINALYFQGKWVNQFPSVERFPFRLNKKKIVFTNMMLMSADVNYYKSPELKATFLELPYEGGEISMTIVLPNDIEGLFDLETRIADIVVAPKYETKKVDVAIPKFKIETTTSLIPVLQALGITDAFSDAANFTGIGDNKAHLVISEAVQKAFIEVDEKGTTAAAATILEVNRFGGEPVPPHFIADHPFIFYLRHKVNGVFFIGRYSVAEEVEKN